jgi:hypothetical protein
MGYQYIVKRYQWVNGIISAVAINFDDEQLALEYARSMSPAETIKVYVEDQVVYAANSSIISPSYSG